MDTNFDLYEALSLERAATPADIKSAYRRAALVAHPDKLPPGATPEQVDAANAAFQRVGFAYAVLRDEKRRERYDSTGETDDGANLRTEAEWKDYFRELWSGEVNAQTLDDFKRKYQGSDEERDDILALYASSKGDLDHILAGVMCSTVEDEDRFVELINDAITAGTVPSTPKWKKALKDTKGKERRRAKAKKEASEAEQYAKELGVHDKLFGDRSTQARGNNVRGKGKTDDPDAALRALIQDKQQHRMGSMLDSLEAKYGAQEKENKQGKKKRPAVQEPTEEEFLRVQAEVDARRSAKAEPAASKRSKKAKT